MIKKNKVKNFETSFIFILFSVAAVHVVDMLIRIKGDWFLTVPPESISIFYYLPSKLTECFNIFYLMSGIFFISAISYFVSSSKRLFYVVNLLMYFLLVSQYLQNTTSVDHRAGLTTLIYFICLVPILLENTKWTNLVWKSIFLSIIVFYFLSGLHKLIVSGPSWASGTALQVYALYTFKIDNILGKNIITNLNLAKFLQLFVFILELSSPFILFKRYRYLWAIGIILFHIGLETLFFYRYFAHAFFVIFMIFYLDQEKLEL